VFIFLVTPTLLSLELREYSLWWAP